MSVYKDTKNNTWKVYYRFTDWQGKTHQSTKRGFSTKREALAWEREQLHKVEADMDMTFESFIDTYTADMKNRLKENTWHTKEHIIRTKLLPYFAKRKMNSIQPKDIIAWQNEMIKCRDKSGEAYSPVYLKTLHNQLSAIFNHAVKFYGLKDNPADEVGKGSVNHNSRKFKAENVDGSRTHLNIDYCNERIQTVYHQLFDEALKRYNEKQTRSDRRIPNYYEKIRSGNQEKPFHEIVLQIGNKEDMSATGEYAELARQVLDEYYQGFQERNPNLRVFSAHLHMDEATPHIHIDFVPFTTGSKRGLDTRVSLKQALAAQGFKGGTRGATEWAQWVQSEKEQLAAVMERYDIQWEQKGTHEKHLSVLDYKKQEREKEIAALDSTLAEKQDELETVQSRIDNFDQGVQSIEKLEQRIESDAEFQLPDPPTLMTAKTYKQRFVDPLIKKLKEVIREVFYHYYKALDSYHRLNTTNGRLYRENEHLTATNDRLKGENDVLRSELKDFRFLRKVLGSQQIDNLIAQAKDMEQQRKQTQCTRRRNTNFER